ncbi:hypothetical protein ABZ922_37885 [Streptomyces shenzhenensis]|uniref:hypothetical protein n=1 Tax=Streptomyces shenzhenensis TaxID=943815 RepID=UPI003404AC76
MAEYQADLMRLASVVKARRLELRWSKQRAADEAGVTIVTYRNVEAGRSARETTYAGIDRAFDWAPGTCTAILQGAESPQPAGTVVEGVRYVSPATTSLDAEETIRRVVQDVMIAVLPDATAREISAANETIIETLKRKGVLRAT